MAGACVALLPVAGLAGVVSLLLQLRLAALVVAAVVVAAVVTCQLSVHHIHRNSKQPIGSAEAACACRSNILQRSRLFQWGS